jgi:hypothetical protein
MKAFIVTLVLAQSGIPAASFTAAVDDFSVCRTGDCRA